MFSAHRSIGALINGGQKSIVHPTWLKTMQNYIGRLAVLHNEQYDLALSQALSTRLAVPLYYSVDKFTPEDFF
ncbi:MAG: hypothetical protein KAJ63_05535, partial [Methyloprofundus sp.]|nr:hypothetical protein [Methyloprofundus sp.]